MTKTKFCKCGHYLFKHHKDFGCKDCTCPKDFEKNEMKCKNCINTGEIEYHYFNVLNGKKSKAFLCKKCWEELKSKINTRQEIN